MQRLRLLTPSPCRACAKAKTELLSRFPAEPYKITSSHTNAILVPVQGLARPKCAIRHYNRGDESLFCGGCLCRLHFCVKTTRPEFLFTVISLAGAENT